MYKHTVRAKSSNAMTIKDLSAEVATPTIEDCVVIDKVLDESLLKACNAMIQDSADIIAQRVMRAVKHAANASKADKAANVQAAIAKIVWSKVGTNAKGFSDKAVERCNGLLVAAVAAGKATVEDMAQAIGFMQAANYVELEALYRKVIPQAFVKKTKKVSATK